MDAFWLVLEEKEKFGSMRRLSLRGREPLEPGEPPVLHMSDGETYNTEDEAKAAAAQHAGRRNKPFFVCRVIGFQQPTYDPEIGWTPMEVAGG